MTVVYPVSEKDSCMFPALSLRRSWLSAKVYKWNRKKIKGVASAVLSLSITSLVN